MWLSPLPDPQLFREQNDAPSFSENILFTQKIRESYSYPEHTSPLGLLTILNGTGKFAVNRQSGELNSRNFMVVNNFSRLCIQYAAGNSQPALLFFQARLPSVVAACITGTDEQLLDNPEVITGNDFSILERIHPITDSLRGRILLLSSLGGGSSSFAALKSDLIVRSILEELLICNQAANMDSFKIGVKKSSTRIELHKRMSAAKEWIDANYHLPLRLEDLAAQVCMNSQHFLRTFKKLFQCTPHQYIIDTRLEQAKKRLLETSASIHSICRDTGLESLSSFSWLFKKRFGVAPSHYRKKR